MNIVKSAFLAVSLALTAGACGGVEGAVEDWAEASCKCKDQSCAEKQKQAFDKIESEYRDDIKDMSKAEAKKVGKHYKKGAKCLREFDVHAG